MIEQSTLLRLAHEYSDRKTFGRHSVRAVMLIGSVARGEPALGDSTDIDVIVVDDAPPEPAAELARLSDYVFVDAVSVRPDAYADRKAVRGHHFSAPAVNEAMPLHDPSHYFDILQAAVRAPYYRPDQIYARARSSLNAARRHFDQLLPLREAPPPAALTFGQLFDLHQTLYLAANAALLLAPQVKGEAAGPRKLMVRYESAARQLQPDLYPLFLAALGASDLAAEAVESFVDEWLAQYKAANRRGESDPLIHPFRRGYYERGFRALIAGGHAINTLWLIEHTLAACVRGLDPPPEAWRSLQRLMGKDSGEGIAERLHHTAGLLDLTEETLVVWAKRENVDE